MSDPKTIIVPFSELGGRERAAEVRETIMAGAYDDPEHPSRRRGRGFGWKLISLSDSFCFVQGSNFKRNWRSFKDCMIRAGFEVELNEFAKKVGYIIGTDLASGSDSSAVREVELRPTSIMDKIAKSRMNIVFMHDEDGFLHVYNREVSDIRGASASAMG